MLNRVGLVVILDLAACACALALGEDQLYTGSAITTAPGHALFQLFYSSAPGAGARVAGSSVYTGLSGNADARVGYGYLWSQRGPDVQLGPSVGLKWRFAGDGRRRPSAAISCLYAANQTPGNPSKRSDVGGLLIVQYPVRPVVLLANLGRVWVGDDVPDLRYEAFAVAAPLSQRMLVAVEYIQVARLDTLRGGDVGQYVLGAVYHPRPEIGYSLQLGRLIGGSRTGWNTTVGVSVLM
jgi:hypothetical protein